MSNIFESFLSTPQMLDVSRMRANIDAVRQVLPAQAADEGFDPALAGHAAGLARAQLAAWRVAAVPLA